MAVPGIIEEILRNAEGTDIKTISGKSLGGGCINHAMKLKTNKGDFFVKWNDAGPSDLFLREAECLEELAKAGSTLKVPRVIAKTAAKNNQPAILITEFLPPSDRLSDYDEQLGRGLAELHRYTREKFGFYHDNYCGATLQNNAWSDDWVSFFGSQRIDGLVRLIRKSRGFDQGQLQLIDKLQDKLPDLVGHQPSPSLIHGDLWSGNYMTTSFGAAIIDPASCYADREFEFSIMNMFGGFSTRVFDAYNEVFPLPSEWKIRNELYMLYHYLNHYHLFGGYYGDQAMSIVKRYI